MQLPLKQLEQIKPPLLPVYLIQGNVPLLVEEARDTLRQLALTQGFHQRELFIVETGFDWNIVMQSMTHFNLFSEKTFLEIRNPTGKFDDAATKILLHYLENAPPDKLLLIMTEKLTAAQQKTKWFKAVDNVGAIITIWPVSLHELPRWIAARFQQANLKANTDSLSLLAELTEGNLLSTQQAIEKLKLLYPQQVITPKEIAAVINDNARFTVFDVTNYALAGSAQRTIRALSGLHFCGTEITLVLWSVVRELRELYTCAKQVEQGHSMHQVLATQWQSRRPLLKNALSRLTCKKLQQLLQYAHTIDTMIKGVTPGDAWQALERLCLSLAGKDILLCESIA